MVKIAICDDNLKELMKYKDLLSHYFETSQETEKVIVHVFKSGEELWFQIHEKDFYHIYLLDIELGEDRMNGLKTAEKIRKIQPDAIIIFLTQHLKYSIAGYRYGAIRYVTKNSGSSKLVEAIKEAKEQLKKKANQYLMCRRYNDYERVSYDEILSVYKNGQYSEITLKDQKVIREKSSIEQIFNALNDKRFVWIDRKSIINMDYLKRIEEGRVVMVDGSIHETSKAKLKALKNALFEQWEEQRGNER